jgi:hypothetical protein
VSVPTTTPNAGRKQLFSLDSWAVLTAFVAALLVWAGVFKHVPW